MTDGLPRLGRLAGIDYGSVRIGVAVTDPDQKLASPLEIYTRRGASADDAWLAGLVAREQIAGFVVGLPIHTSGTESAKSTEARSFSRWIAEQTGRPVRLFDERYTTVQAEAMLLEADLTSKRRKARLDKLAAQVLLTAYLESSRTADEPREL